jgi:tRNA dimethylallyltransferase
MHSADTDSPSASSVSTATAAGYCLVGPTAVGKTRVAHLLAQREQRPVVSADAMLVYRGMDIATAKPTVAERGQVRYVGIDIVAASRAVSVVDWLQAVQVAFAKGVAPIVTGGTGLYLRALVEGLDAVRAPDPERRAHWQRVLSDGGVEALRESLRTIAPGALESLPDPQNARRLIRALERTEAGHPPAASNWPVRPSHVPFVGLRLPVDALRRRIELRVHAMYDRGLLREAEALAARADGLSATARQAIGYAEAFDVLAGRCTQADAMARTAARTRRLAKRQRTWFLRQARVTWIDIDIDDPAEDVAERVVACWRRVGPTPLMGVAGDAIR